jgi:hypothetical protein
MWDKSTLQPSYVQLSRVAVSFGSSGENEPSN